MKLKLLNNFDKLLNNFDKINDFIICKYKYRFFTSHLPRFFTVFSKEF
jgi:hypothetical protein